MVFLVSEIGVNWDGDVNLVREMVSTMKRIGFDAVKFQAYNEKIIGDHPEKDRLMKSTINKDNIDLINDICKDARIEWFCTPMYPEAVDFLNPFVSRFKIREHDGRELLENKSTPLLDKVFATDKEVIVSTQYSTNNCTYKKNVKWLYCVPKYPCVLEDLDFKSLDEYDGFSNHCRQIIAPITAAILGSKIIEIHISANRTLDYIDNNVSFDFNELSEIVSQIRLSEKIQK